MNIISNSCIGAYLQRDFFKTTICKSFLLATIKKEDLIKIIKNYNKINFNKIDLINENSIYSILIDKTVKVCYEHYRKSNDIKIKIVKGELNGENVYYKDIEKYIIEKYNERLLRMTEPLFLF